MIYHVNSQLYQRMLIIAALQAVEFQNKWTKRLYRQVKKLKIMNHLNLFPLEVDDC